MPSKVNAYIALGSNMDNPRQQVLDAIQAIKAIPGCTLVKCSTLVETAPVGYLEQDNFINAVVKVQTTLEPLALLQALQKIEQAQGRVRTIKNGPRTIDCDVLWIDGVKMHSEVLTLPHPRMHERAFVMEPLLEIEPEWSI